MNGVEQVDSALNPLRGKTRVGERPLSAAEQLQRAAAFCAINPEGAQPKCAGQVFVGLFFDGTGNNEDADYKAHQSDPRNQKHTNVVRLYHAHPGPLTIAANGYYRYYMPGLGTPFPEIGDEGPVAPTLTDDERAHAPRMTPLEHLGQHLADGIDGFKNLSSAVAQKAGSAAALNGAPRVVWALTRLFNAISQHACKDDLIDKDTAKAMARSASLLMVATTTASVQWGHWKDDLKTNWQNKLKQKIARRTPIDLLTVNVFGFSRGAAEARTFAHWLFDLCEKKGDQYLFAGIPLRLQFMGLFDTVASVGVAGLYQYVEGRAGWADRTMQIHPRVEQCVHMVASTEARACFPLDSARINARYPPNVTEYVYPGSHSDVGGGYLPMALGRNDWHGTEDKQVARVPGYEMYCAALACGVPFQIACDTQTLAGRPVGLGSFKPLAEKVAQALKPSPATAAAFDAYYAQADIQAGPVEEMARQHLSLYLTYRLHNNADWRTAPAVQLANLHPNAAIDKGSVDEPIWMKQTQLALVAVLVGLCNEIQRRREIGVAKYALLKQHFDPLQQETDGFLFRAPLGTAGSSVATIASAARGLFERMDLMRRHDTGKPDEMTPIARQAPRYLKLWRDTLQKNAAADIRNTAVQLDAVRLLEAIRSNPVPRDVALMFETLVHDSMAGFIGFGMPEFQLNGYGIAKHRRIFFGDEGDDMLRKEVERRNREKRTVADKERAALDEQDAKDRAQKAKWNSEAAEFRRTIPR